MKLELNRVAIATPWANLFATNRLETKGMNLNYISRVIIDGEKVVEIWRRMWIEIMKNRPIQLSYMW
ncbi:hypothetical protein R3W88_022825 [Solanum pinnatisectum]|uniref:Uncharacterized protein n=1 Tax=Solanum pinnatisectum TaxID=50273 RepID=A0AAV9LZN1_9SOLN|nr:hypothetical protein R3W88_022825 [Solanum pinnatisectum]